METIEPISSKSKISIILQFLFRVYMFIPFESEAPVSFYPTFIIISFLYNLFFFTNTFVLIGVSTFFSYIVINLLSIIMGACDLLLYVFTSFYTSHYLFNNYNTPKTKFEKFIRYSCLGLGPMSKIIFPITILILGSISFDYLPMTIYILSLSTMRLFLAILWVILSKIFK
jgi:hypothetical protein